MDSIITQVPTNVSYLALFLLIALESAGLPVPGETSLSVAAVLAARGHLFLPLVFAVAASAAIIGDNIGFYVGRRGGRWLLERDGFAAERRRRFLHEGEAFFERHGGKTVFFARWLPVLRFTGALLAGAHRMEWRRFFFWNAAGGIGWVLSVGTAAYLLGSRAGNAFAAIGAVALLFLVLGALGHLAWRRLRPRSLPDASDG